MALRAGVASAAATGSGWRDAASTLAASVSSNWSWTGIVAGLVLLSLAPFLMSWRIGVAIVGRAGAAAALGVAAGDAPTKTVSGAMAGLAALDGAVGTLAGVLARGVPFFMGVAARPAGMRAEVASTSNWALAGVGATSACLVIGVALAGVALAGVALAGVALAGVALAGVALAGVPLMGVGAADVPLTGVGAADEDAAAWEGSAMRFSGVILSSSVSGIASSTSASPFSLASMSMGVEAAALAALWVGELGPLSFSARRVERGVRMLLLDADLPCTEFDPWRRLIVERGVRAKEPRGYSKRNWRSAILIKSLWDRSVRPVTSSSFTRTPLVPMGST